MASKKATKFYGGVIERVLVVFPKGMENIYTKSDYDFIRKKFNSCRNYRKFNYNQSVEISVATTQSLPSLDSYTTSDACLLIGKGRFIDKDTYDFAKKCFMQKIPVFFIRSNSLEVEPVHASNPTWSSPKLVTEIDRETRFGKSTYKITHLPPAKYFMQIPSVSDFIRTCNGSDSLYALFPAMVPI